MRNLNALENLSNDRDFYIYIFNLHDIEWQWYGLLQDLNFWMKVIGLCYFIKRILAMGEKVLPLQTDF